MREQLLKRLEELLKGGLTFVGEDAGPLKTPALFIGEDELSIRLSADDRCVEIAQRVEGDDLCFCARLDEELRPSDLRLHLKDRDPDDGMTAIALERERSENDSKRPLEAHLYPSAHSAFITSSTPLHVSSTQVLGPYFLASLSCNGLKLPAGFSRSLVTS